MDTSKLKKFAQAARRSLMDQVTAKLKLVLAEGSVARREQTKAVQKLEAAIKADGRDRVIERVAYTWFNRFCALRFMDANRYTGISAVSPAEGQSQPELLAEAKMGHIDEQEVPEAIKRRVLDLLAGSTPSRDPQAEAYRLLLVAVCNHWHRTMPFLFQEINDYTELLMPDDLLSDNAILAATRDAMPVADCADVEIIGWLYQFYISEKKDEVFDGLKKNKKITPENIPAATQLFTPHWIVRYLVENSLGRLWMLNRPNSKLIDKMEYYIKPVEPEKDFLRIAKPEDIKLCDPACGSGHMLTYSFDLLYAIYEEEGYEPSEIPGLILKHNLYGIEIDERAGELAAFALTMKARAKYKRFFSKVVQPNICVLENIQFDDDELRKYMDHIGRDLFTAPLQSTLRQFEEADNFGSLIRPEVTVVVSILKILEAKNVSGELFLSTTHQKVLKALRQADYLSPKYHVVIANPPYLGRGGMNARLAAWLKDNYDDVKSDIFSAFIVRNTELTLPKGQLGFMSPFVWMFISSYEKLRSLLIKQKTITSLVQLEYSGFDGATVPICTFTVENSNRPDFKGGYVKLSDFRGAANQAPRTLEAIRNRDCGWFYRASSKDFDKIPGSPIAFWISESVRSAFSNNVNIGEYISPAVGLNTGDNDRFLRIWSEVSTNRTGFGFAQLEDAAISGFKWFPYNKGGPYRKWYGNIFFLLNWENDGQEVKEYAVQRNQGKHWSRYIQNLHFMLREGVSWTATSSSYFGCRYTAHGFFFDVKGTSGFSDIVKPKVMAAYLGSKVVSSFLKFLNPTIEFQTRDIRNLPYNDSLINDVRLENLSEKSIATSKADWDSFETSWDFTSLPLLSPDYRQPTLKATYQKLRAHWREMTLEMQRLEEENNRIFIDAYSLQDELTPDVPLKEITLTCNPHYRYGSDRTKEELEALLLADTMREFISYNVGCMFGRYALDKPGLILANQGETIRDYLKKIPEPSFPADEDNVIPMLDGDWFTDDVTERFYRFLRVTFGEEHFEENLVFIEEALGKDIRKYFISDFYKDHVRRYKKRPIYWLFSSSKGSFNALIYMHRYRPDTVSVVLNEYLREFRTKLSARLDHLQRVEISADTAKSAKTKALKEIIRLKKIVVELDEYERDILFPLAAKKIEIDLDDGVKVNYPKFGAALKPIPGLDAKDEDE